MDVTSGTIILSLYMSVLAFKWLQCTGAGALVWWEFK